MNMLRRSVTALMLAAGLLASSMLLTVASPSALAQERRVELKPDGSLDNAFPFLSKAGFVIEQTATVADAKAVATTLLFTVPKGPLGDPTYVGGLPQAGVAATLSFYVTSVQVETTAATAITAGAAFRVGTPANDQAVLASSSLANTPVVNGYQHFGVSSALVLHSGDVVNFKITTGAVGTSQALKVHLLGYYQ